MNYYMGRDREAVLSTKMDIDLIFRIDAKQFSWDTLANNRRIHAIN